MVVLVILIGVYFLLAWGYKNMVQRAVPELEEAALLVAFVSFIWPVAIVYTLFKEAVT